MNSLLSTTLLLLLLSTLKVTAASYDNVKTDVSINCPTSIRRSWRDLTCHQQDEFLDAIITLKESGLYDAFREIHEYYGNLTHSTPMFLPWHRWFLWNFEKALQAVTGKCISVPYWDLERDAGDPTSSSVFHAETFGSFGNHDPERWCILDGRFNSTSDSSLFRHASFYLDDVEDDCLQREYAPWVDIAGEAEILADIVSFPQFANIYDEDGEVEHYGFRSVLEGSPHGFPHLLLGGHMSTNYSPDDPMFYVHHSNMDRLWALWQSYHGYDKLSYEDYATPTHYEGNLLDEPMPFDLENMTWDFRMYRDFPTPRDLMSIDQPHISVRYVNDYLSSLIPEFDPNPKWFQPAEGYLNSRCHRESANNNDNERSLAMGDRVKHLDNELKSDGAAQHLRGQAIISTATHNPLPNSCQQRNTFTRQEDRDRWDHLCQTMPTNTSVADRLAMMAKLDCEERWTNDVLSGPSQKALAIQQWIKTINKQSQSATFECFHSPHR